MDIIDRLKAKDEYALIEIMDQYGTYLKRTVYLTIRDEQVAEEIVQDTFVQAFNKIAQIQDYDKLRSWLTSIAVNLCRSKLRKKKLKILSIDEDLPLKDEQQTPEEKLVALSKYENLTKSILTLDYKYREVIALHYFNEYNVTEIAAITNSKENTIKSRLMRARHQLYELLEKEEKRYG